MTNDWFVAMGTDVRYPHGNGSRILVGHRLLLALSEGPRSARELHAALGGRVPARERRAALGELRAAGLVFCAIHKSGSRGGRPRQEWTLLFPRSAAVAAARAAVRAADARRRARRVVRASVPSPSATPAVPLATSARSGAQRHRRRRPVPSFIADQVLDWVAGGNYLRHFCRRRGAPAARTIYAWAAKDPEFRRRLQGAREFGEMLIAERMIEIVDSPLAMCMLRSRSSRATFRQRYIRPIQLKLQRWRKHPRRARPRISARQG